MFIIKIQWELNIKRLLFQIFLLIFYIIIFIRYILFRLVPLNILSIKYFLEKIVIIIFNSYLFNLFF